MLKPIGFAILAAGIAIASVSASVASQVETFPAPETQLAPRMQVKLNSDRINITLINQTNAAITYEAIGDTQVRTLPGRTTITLQGLRVPTTLTLRRQDFGLLNVTPKQSAKSTDTIEVTLDATTNLGADGITMQVENNGSVFIY